MPRATLLIECGPQQHRAPQHDSLECSPQQDRAPGLSAPSLLRAEGGLEPLPQGRSEPPPPPRRRHDLGALPQVDVPSGWVAASS
jgi:hypothetical protein